MRKTSFKMMGPYQYYDTTFIEDIHDCMWSGECSACNSAGASTPVVSCQPAAPTAVVCQPAAASASILVCQPSTSVITLSADRSPTPPSVCKTTETTPEPVPRKVKLLRSNSSSDSKKLRHREVEKNRHRQLQAMVKTLSDKIPGKLDKETQVQTMKRAARYCIYLRDVVNLLPRGTKANNLHALKDKLEKIYFRSCDNVELIIRRLGE